MCIPYGPTLHKAGTLFIDAYLFLGFKGTQTKGKGEDLLGALRGGKSNCWYSGKSFLQCCLIGLLK